MPGITGNAELVRVRADFNSIGAALRSYKINAGSYPSTSQGLRALVERPTSAPVPRMWSKCVPSVPKDPWQHEYEYRFPGSKDPGEFEIISRGKDGQSELSSQDMDAAGN